MWCLHQYQSRKGRELLAIPMRRRSFIGTACAVKCVGRPRSAIAPAEATRISVATVSESARRLGEQTKRTVKVRAQLVAQVASVSAKFATQLIR